MSDTAPFSPFSPAPPPKPMFEGETAKPAKKTGRKKPPKVAKPARKPRKAKDRHNLAEQVKVLGADSLLPPEKVPTRKRAAKQPRAAKFTLFEALQVTRGLADEDCGLFSKLLNQLEAASKPARVRIVAALGKVFS